MAQGALPVKASKVMVPRFVTSSALYGLAAAEASKVGIPTAFAPLVSLYEHVAGGFASTLSLVRETAAHVSPEHVVVTASATVATLTTRFLTLVRKFIFP
ncbi:hypothetical protein ACNPQM_20660 [Streptomyces sp. NPDC056231]|uniref:hypothetical protein n=1 Tax=Streptomyces sp. NPDC056231 TaxID=3345755 RepID=UPI003AABAA8E